MTKKERHELFLRTCEDYWVQPKESFDKYLWDNGFFTAPASTKYHGAYEGGLFDHSFQVFGRLLSLTKCNELEWMRPESPFIVGMFHDICKIDQYIENKEYATAMMGGVEITLPQEITKFEYNKDTLLKGHGAKSIMLLSQFMTLTEEEILCIRYHMGPYEKEEWAEYDMAIRKYENVLWTHHADMLASKVDDI